MRAKSAERGDPEASREWRAGRRSVSRAWDEQRELLQVAVAVWRYGRQLDGSDERAR